MATELMLLRHGKSDWNISVDDFSRPLKDRGKRGAQRIGAWLQEQALIPDLILTSPAERALVTTEKCCKAMGLTIHDFEQQSDLYNANLNTLLDVIECCLPLAERIMLVGHNPGLEDLTKFLLGEACPAPADGKLLPTATLAHIKLCENTLKRNCGNLVNIIRAKTLPEKFPYIPPNGIPVTKQIEYRDRPSYYYTQSSLIPYRVINNEIQILLIGSSSKKRWVVPKGIVEPGLSPGLSAQKEALEEAGVEGTLSGEALGRYSREKWGGVCDIEVFAMRVDRMQNEEDWKEKHRGREWVNANEAKNRVGQAKLIPLIDKLITQLSSKTISG